MKQVRWVKYKSEFSEEIGIDTWDKEEELVGAAIIIPIYNDELKWWTQLRFGINGDGKYFCYRQFGYTILQKQIDKEESYEKITTRFLPSGKAVTFNLLPPGGEIIDIKNVKYISKESSGKWFTIIVLDNGDITIKPSSMRWDKLLETRRNNIIRRRKE